MAPWTNRHSNGHGGGSPRHATDGVTGERLDAALERARAEVMRLAKVADDLEASLPKQVSTAVRDGIAREVVPVSRSLAEIRGGVNQALRRLERLEQELLAERNARIDDLAILVDLVSSGWSGVDERLRKLEAGLQGAVVPFRAEREDATLPPRPQPTRRRAIDSDPRLAQPRASTMAHVVAQAATVTSSGTSSTRSASGSSPSPRRCSSSRYRKSP